MSEFTKLIKRSEVAENTGASVTIDGKRIAVFNTGEDFVAMDDDCVHRGGPLSEGTLEDGCVACPWHQWKFDLKTGKCASGPQANMRTYTTKVEGEDLLALI